MRERARCHRAPCRIFDRSAPQKRVWRATIILATAEGCGTAEIMRRSGKSKPVVWRWQARLGFFISGRTGSSNPFRCRATTLHGRVSTGRTTMGASRFFGLDAIEWSVTLTGSVLLALTAWMM
jgi:hypothetical protein